MGNARATFLIDADGVVRHVIPKASPKTHDDEVLAALGDARRGLVLPEVLDHLRVGVLVAGGAEGEDLGALGAALQSAGQVGRHADGVPGAELDDLVVELDARAAGHDDVDLFLVGVAVAEGHAEARRRLEVAEAGVLELQSPAGEARLEVGRVAELGRLVLDLLEIDDRCSRT